MNRVPPTIDMRPDGSFIAPPRSGLTLSAKIMIGAFVIAVIAGSLALAAVAVWLLSLLLPVIVAAALVGFATIKYRQWQAARRRGVVPRA